MVAIAVVAFLFMFGPAWWEPFDYTQLWGKIFWSYLLIPVMVGALLLARRKLTLLGFVLETCLLVFVKFVITATFMMIVWAIHGPPPPVPLESAVRPADLPREPELPDSLAAPVATVLDAATLARVEIVVRDRAGAPVEGALVYLADTLGELVFARRADPVTIAQDADGVHPPLVAVQVGQPLDLRSGDGRLHALRGVLDDGRVAFNQPMIVAGARRVLPQAWGSVTLACAAHPAEAGGRMIVLSHPFHARTEADGRAAFDGVPAGPRVVVATIDRVSTQIALDVSAGAPNPVEATLPR